MKHPGPRYITLCFLLIVAQGVVGNNSPPLLKSSKKWIVGEDEPVGSVVENLRAFDNEHDVITFTLVPRRPSDVIHHYLTIDSYNRVVIAKKLTGLAGESKTGYMVGVQLDDGHTATTTEVMVLVEKPGLVDSDTSETSGPPLPPGFGQPGGLMELPGGFGRHPQVPALNLPLPPPPPIPDSPGPPVLFMNRPWAVTSDAGVGTVVSRVDVRDLSGAGYNLTLLDPAHLLRLDQASGQVTVVAPLTGKVGNYNVTVRVDSPHGGVSEPVVVRVLPPTPAPSPPVTVTFIPPRPRPAFPSGGGNNRQDLRVVGGSSGDEAGAGVPTTPTPPQESDVNLTVIPIVVVAGLSPLLVLLYCCFRRYRRINSSIKKASVVYNEKGEEAAATEIRTEGGSERRERSQRRGSSILSLAALWRRSAYSNKYEDGLRDSKTRRVSEVAPSTTDAWEFPRHRLRVMSILGEGCFGQVWRCEAMGLAGQRSMVVAAKTLKESAGDRERRDLLQELKVLKSLARHPNVVSLLGCCTEKDPIFVILEYMSGGKLQSYLRASRGDAAYNNMHGTSSLTPRDLTLFAYQIARGMEFLASKGIIHRDLAARNVLVGEEKVCKVADFGFARDVANNHVYERKSDGRLPIRWMAPESLFDNIFTTKSDVWSFGVLLWEIVTLGSTPYPGHGATEVMKKVKEGYRLEKPDHCRREIYNIMYYCWDKDQKERPSFSELVVTLEGLLMSEVEYIQLDRFPDHTYYNFITEKSDELL